MTDESGSKIPVFKKILAFSQVLHNSGYSVEVNFLGSGGGFGTSEQVNVPVLPDMQLLQYFRECVKEIKNMGYAGVFLHIENLELLSRYDLDKAKAYFLRTLKTIPKPSKAKI